MSQVIRLRPARLSSLEVGIVLIALLVVAVILTPMLLRGSNLIAARAPAIVESAPVLAPASSASAIVGWADVRDGDGLRINGETIRLQGVDAFELHQTCGTGACGEAARAALEAMTLGRQVACEPVDTDRYGRTIAFCSVDGRDVGAQLVRQGHALAYRRYSLTYVDEEAAARSAGAGAWAGSFQNPADWRREHPRS